VNIDIQWSHANPDPNIRIPGSPDNYDPPTAFSFPLLVGSWSGSPGRNLKQPRTWGRWSGWSGNIQLVFNCSSLALLFRHYSEVKATMSSYYYYYYYLSMGHCNFSFTQSYLPHYGHGVDSASNRNEHRGSLLVGKDGRCVGLTSLPSSRADCLEVLGASTS
jgi:hypothetical protein